MDADLLCTIYEKSLLPTATNWFGPDQYNWVLQEDNDPKHTSKEARGWREAHGIVRMPWPSQSPDQNPIENVWMIVKSELARCKPTSIMMVKRLIARIWRHLPKQYSENLVASMQRRLEAIIEAKGDYTLY
jgi:transposase